MAYDRKTGLARMLEAASKRKQADIKLQTEVMKMKLGSDMRLKEHAAKEKMKRESPDQMFLRRRAMEEDPLMRLSIPTEGSDSTDVEFPADEVVQDKSGMFETKPIDEDKKNQLYLAKLERMLQAAKSGKGPMPNQAALKIGDRMRERMNRKLGYKGEGSSTSSDGSPKVNKATQDFLDMLSEEMANGKIRTQNDAAALMDKKRGQLTMRGANLQHINEQIVASLPETAEKKKGLGDTIAKIGNALYKKVSGGWQLHKEEEPTLVDEESE